jgi:hypothetical protein
VTDQEFLAAMRITAFEPPETEAEVLHRDLEEALRIDDARSDYCARLEKQVRTLEYVTLAQAVAIVALLAFLLAKLIH